MDSSSTKRGKDDEMRSAKKFIAVVSLSAAPILVGGVAGATAAGAAVAAPATAPAHTAHSVASVHSVHGAAAPAPSESNGSETADANAEQVTTEADGPGGHADTPGANVDHQFSGTE
jgi:hypothetical protein